MSFPRKRESISLKWVYWILGLFPTNYLGPWLAHTTSQGPRSQADSELAPHFIGIILRLGINEQTASQAYREWVAANFQYDVERLRKLYRESGARPDWLMSEAVVGSRNWIGRRATEPYELVLAQRCKGDPTDLCGWDSVDIPMGP